MAEGDRKDPYVSYHFLVEFFGVIEAGFSEVSGLQVETDTEEYREGGVNDYVHKLPKVTKYPNIVMKKGITDSDILWKWHQGVVNGLIVRSPIFVLLLDSNGNEKWRWLFKEAYPVKWIGPEFKADSNSIAFEAIEFSHNGILGISIPI